MLAAAIVGGPEWRYRAMPEVVSCRSRDLAGGGGFTGAPARLADGDKPDVPFWHRLRSHRISPLRALLGKPRCSPKMTDNNRINIYNNTRCVSSVSSVGICCGWSNWHLTRSFVVSQGPTVGEPPPVVGWCAISPRGFSVDDCTERAVRWGPGVFLQGGRNPEALPGPEIQVPPSALGPV